MNKLIQCLEKFDILSEENGGINLKKKVIKIMMLEISIILLISFVATIPIFLNKSGVISGVGHEDWAFHFGRVRSIISALKQGELPVGGNYLDFASQGIGVNAAYPFFSLYLFIWPFLLPIRLKYSVFVFVFLLNFILAINAWGFISEFTQKIWIKISVTLLFIFNNYHLLLMYKRMALGELLGYTMVPLVAWGLLRIWKNKKSGIILLAWGVSLIINSHILSLVIVILALILVELTRIIGRKFNIMELKYILSAALLTLPMASVTVYNFLTISLQNKYVTPAITIPLNDSSILPGIYLLDLKHILNPIPLTMLNAKTWNVSALLLILSVIAIVYLLAKRNVDNLYYILSGAVGLLLLVLSSNMVNWNFTEKINIFSSIRVIQFPGRLLMIAVLFLIIPIIKLMIDIKLPTIKAAMMITILIFLINGIMTIGRTTATYNNYLPEDIMTVGMNNQVFTTDYYPEAKLNKKAMTAAVRVSHSYIDGPITYGWSNPTFKSAQYQIKVNTNKLPSYVVTPAIMYHGFQYDVRLNGHAVQWKRDADYGTIAIKAKQIHLTKLNKLEVTIKPLKFEMLLTIINGLTYLITMVVIACFFIKTKLAN